MIGEDDAFSALHERLHAARRRLAEAYEARDLLACEIAALEARGGIGMPGELLDAFGAAEWALLMTEADMKDAEHALAVANERLP